MKNKDYYKILGVEKNASQDDIKKSYRKLAKKFHPDTNPGNKAAEQKFKDINEAYETIGDSKKRKEYDDYGNSEYFGSQGGFGRSRGGGSRSTYSNMFDSDFFDSIFSNGGNDFFGSRPKKGEDIETNIEITLEEAYKGIEKRVTIRNRNGDKNISFRVPSGIKDEEKIRLQGQGEIGNRGGQNGDLILNVKIKKEDNLELDGIDIIKTIDIMSWDAVLGCEVKVSTFDGTILVRIPEGIQTGSKIRVPGKGFINKNGRKGDMYIKIRIIISNKITNEMKELYNKLREMANV